VVEKLASEKKENPLIMLDELDKVGGDMFESSHDTGKGFFDEF